MTLGDLLHTSYHATEVKIIYAEMDDGKLITDTVYEGIVDDSFDKRKVMQFYYEPVWDIKIEDNVMKIFV